MSEKKEPTVYRRTRLDELHDYWNGHIHKQIAFEINIKALSDVDPKEVFAEEQIQLTPGAQPVYHKILVGDTLKKNQRDLEMNGRIIKTIAEMIKAEENNPDAYVI